MIRSALKIKPSGPRIGPNVGKTPTIKRSVRRLGNRAELIFKLPRKERTTLTKEMGMQVRKYVTRYVSNQIQPFKPATQLERKLRELERRLYQSKSSLKDEMTELQKVWAAALVSKAPSDQEPQVARLLQKGLPGRGTAWMKQRLRRMNQSQGQETSTPLVLLAPKEKEQRASSDSREGLALLLNMLNAIPDAPPALKRLTSRLSKGLPQLKILPPQPNPSKPSRKRGSTSGDGEKLELRQPLKGVLRMKIEPPEAARVLAEHMSFGDIPLVYKQPGSSKAQTVAKAKVKPDSPKITASTSWAQGDVDRIAKAAGEAVRKDLLQDLPTSQIRRLADQVYRVIENRLLVQRQRRGRR